MEINIIEKITNFLLNLFSPKIQETIFRTDEAVGRIDKDVSRIWGEISKHSSGISKHGEEIRGLKVFTGYGISDSPVRPSEQGQKLLENSGFNKIYPELREKVFTLMNSWGLRTLYDYEKGAERALKQLQNNPIIDPLKEYAVNHPDEPLEFIFKVASWVIRDDYDRYKFNQ